MPYIEPSRRDHLDSQQVSEVLPMTAGELNYVFTKVADKYLKQFGLKYQHINDVVGALEGAKLEAYRKVVVGYEDKKCFSNGEVYSKENL